MCYNDVKEEWAEKIKRERRDLRIMTIIFNYRIKSIILYIVTFIISVSIMFGVSAYKEFLRDFTLVIQLVENTALWYISILLSDHMRDRDERKISMKEEFISYMRKEAMHEKDIAWSRQKQGL